MYRFGSCHDRTHVASDGLLGAYLNEICDSIYLFYLRPWNWSLCRCKLCLSKNMPILPVNQSVHSVFIWNRGRGLKQLMLMTIHSNNCIPGLKRYLIYLYYWQIAIYIFLFFNLKINNFQLWFYSKSGFIKQKQRNLSKYKALEDKTRECSGKKSVNRTVVNLTYNYFLGGHLKFRWEVTYVKIMI